MQTVAFNAHSGLLMHYTHTHTFCSSLFEILKMAKYVIAVWVYWFFVLLIKSLPSHENSKQNANSMYYDADDTTLTSILGKWKLFWNDAVRSDMKWWKSNYSSLLPSFTCNFTAQCQPPNSSGKSFIELFKMLYCAHTSKQYFTIDDQTRLFLWKESL